MKLKWLLLSLCLLLILAGCKKDNNSPEVIKKSGGAGTGGTGTGTSSALSIANVLQSNMVVQRGKPFSVWGASLAGAAITVQVSWNSATFSTTANSAGQWNVIIPAALANASPQTIDVTASGTTIKLNNILIGDVWVCSGQSNMVFEVDSIPPFRGVLNYPAEIAAANYPSIRAITLNTDYEASPVDSLTQVAHWQVCSPATVGNMSGVAYYFARELNTTLNVPIGIIISAVDGTSCEAWTSEASFQANPNIINYSDINNATMLYNGMIHPLVNLPISGFIWYQGENNRYNDPPSDYTHLNSDLIAGWRTAFNQGQLPFYFVQMPPFAVDYFTTNPVGGNLLLDDYAKVREAQANVRAVAGTGMAITMDVGEPANQHPRDKKPVGERLALLALKNTYGQNIQCIGPQFASYTTNGANVATINFVAGTAGGLGAINNSPLNQYFFVAGTNQVFVQATAVISGSQVIVTAPASVPLPIKAVRYAFTNAPVTNLQNSAGLPMEPFRTDTWSN
jgi:sialate O-acetylesterase